MLLVIDQGAVVSLNGGETWSSWFTQPTAALYHVMADNAFPYRVCGGQQDSGSACVASRGNDGADHVSRLASGRRRGIRLRRARSARSRHRLRRKSHALRPADRRRCRTSGPTGGGRGGARVPAARRTAPVRTQPVVFSHGRSARALLRATTCCGRPSTAAINWKQISPDLTRETCDVPKSVGKYAPRVRRARAARSARRSSTRSVPPTSTSTASGLAPTTA